MYYIIVILFFLFLVFIYYLFGHILIKNKTKKNKVLIRSFIIGLILAVSNLISYNGNIGNYFFGTLNYCYSNKSYVFNDCELLLKNRKFINIENSFQYYKEQGKVKKDESLYRNFKKNYLFFWLWYDYATHPKWKLEYLQPLEE